MSYSASDFMDEITRALVLADLVAPNAFADEDASTLEDTANLCLKAILQCRDDRNALRASLALMTEHADSFIGDWANDVDKDSRDDFNVACKQLEEAQALLERIPEPPTIRHGEDDNLRVGAIINLAESTYPWKDGEIEIGDENDKRGYMVSESDDNGAYVRAWVWIDFEGTPLDKNTASDEETRS